MESGVVFDIKKYAIHDGPGIRTTVFLKGCPLHCWWCHNPEGQSQNLELAYQPGKCLPDCEECVQACPQGAIIRSSDTIKIDREACLFTGRGVDACPSGALNRSGWKTTDEDIMEKILKDRIFYQNSGGGVTFSGGEPLMQLDFLNSLLDKCRKEEIHRALDTSGYVPFESFQRILDNVDLVLYDLKMMDDEQHKKTTGVSNQLILENLERIDRTGLPVQIRIPVIPGVNDTEKNARRTGGFLKKLNQVKKVHLLPYHRAAASKYRSLGKTYIHPDLKTPEEEKMRNIKSVLDSFGFPVQMGG